MIVVMRVGSPEAEIERVSQELTDWGLTPEKSLADTRSSLV